MKIVNLIGPAVIDGAVRYPIEGPLTVTDKVAQQLEDSKRLDGEPEDLPDDDAPADDGLDGKGVPALKKIAKDEEIDLGEATDKPDIIAVIRAAREAKEG